MEIIYAISVTICGALIIYLANVFRKWFNKTFKEPVKDLLTTIRLLRFDVNVVMKYLMEKNGFKGFMESEKQNQIQSLKLEGLMHKDAHE